MAAQKIKEWYTIAELSKEVGKSVQYISSQCKLGGKLAHLVKLNQGLKTGKQVNKRAIDILNGKESTSLNKKVSTGLNTDLKFEEKSRDNAALELVEDSLNQLIEQQKTNAAQMDQMYQIVSDFQTAESEMRQLLLLEKKQSLQLTEKVDHSDSDEESKKVQQLKLQLAEEKKNAAEWKNAFEELSQDKRLKIPADIHGRPIFRECEEVQNLIKESENAIKLECEDLQKLSYEAGYKQGWNEAKPPWKKAR